MSVLEEKILGAALWADVACDIFSTLCFIRR
jgi:hypothetical protein